MDFFSFSVAFAPHVPLWLMATFAALALIILAFSVYKRAHGAWARLSQLLEGLDLPPLQPVPPDHVLTRSFYLLQDFPGRWSGGQVWVEALPPQDPNRPPEGRIAARGGDGVSPIIMGGNDWAAAWARDEMGQPIAAVVPGGEQQREMAIRFGINVVIYAMTGNYKTDQVHVPALLERLGK